MRLFLASTIVLAAMTACAPTPPAAGAAPTGVALAGAEWVVFEIAGAATVADSKATIAFEDGRVFGAASCNRFMGGYTAAPNALDIKMSQMASTMMACPDALMTQERSYLDTLAAVTSYSIDGAVLTLKTPDGKTIRARR